MEAVGGGGGVLVSNNCFFLQKNTTASLFELYFNDSKLYARGGGGSQQGEVADGADVVFTDTGWCGFRKQYWISCKPLLSWVLTLDLDNFRFI